MLGLLQFRPECFKSAEHHGIFGINLPTTTGMESSRPDMKLYNSHSGQVAYNNLRRSLSCDSAIKTSPIAPVKSIPEDVRLASITQEPFDLTKSEFLTNAPVKDTVLYLAYGSNLSAETFKGVRGIKPLSQVNVHVPELELCFDLPGIPYREPCFANTRLRSVKPPWINDHGDANDDLKIQWQKGLVGVVYEVTKADYAKIIATEGGGVGYQDIVVLCFEIPPGTNIIKPFPTTPPFRAHTLFCPTLPPTKPGEPSPPVGHVGRPDPDYAQPSARYLRLINDGALEHKMPLEYQNYLLRLNPYTITSTKQQIGQAIFTAIWLPVIMAILFVGNKFADESGKVPSWLAILSNLVLTGIWMSYDMIFKPVFGDGERTQEEDDDEQMGRNSWDEKKELLYEV